MNNFILVLEDDLSLKPFWEEIIQRVFFNEKVDWAVSCEEGLRAYRKALELDQPYNLVITDLFLAGAETGLDFIDYLSARSDRVPVILASVADDLEKLGPRENVFLLTKPLNRTLCESALRDLKNSILYRLKQADRFFDSEPT